MKPRQLCGVNKVCRRARAAWWYWPENGWAVFVTFGPKRPNRQAAACCDKCREALEVSYRKVHGVNNQ